MTWNPKEGSHVKTGYGPATISRITKDKVYVILESGPLQGQTIPLPKSSISTLITSEDDSKKSIPSAKQQKTPARKKYYKSIKINEQRCINALRFGLVPNEYIEQLTLGFEDLEKWVLSTFPDSNQSKNQVVHQIVGRFGEGKSHTMSVIRHIAIREGYLVARVEVDGNRVSLSNPQSFLYSLLNTISGKNLEPVMPLLNLYLKAIHEGFSAPTIAPRGIDRIRTIYKLIQLLDSYRYRYIENSDYLLDSVLTCSDEITASEVKKIILDETRGIIDHWSINLYPMIGQKVIDRPHDFVECIVGTAIIAKLAGYKGLIITIDEFEVESALLATKDKMKRATDTLMLLLEYLIGSTEYIDSSLGIYFATVPEEESRWKESIDILVDGSDGKTYTIQAFEGWDSKNSEQISVVKKIHDIYKEGYSCNRYSYSDIISSLDSEIDNTELYDSGGIRRFMKQYIGLLDSLYGPPFGKCI
jgi:hypothetical protein